MTFGFRALILSRLNRMMLVLVAVVALGALTPVLKPSSASEASEKFQGSFRELLDRLHSSTTGKSLLGKTVESWNMKSYQDLASRIRWGDASKTDAVLIRHFDSRSGQESRERQVTVYLRTDQTLEEQVMDLAHELVHATSRPAWDPYDPSLTAGQYIQAAIEGDGGEVQAVATECQVGLELFGKEDKTPNSRCKRYWNDRGKEVIRSDFYRVGKWGVALRADLGHELRLFPLLSDEKPSLYSSTGGTPYPVALMEEYRQMTSVACENSRRRVASVDEANLSKKGRSPASLDGSASSDAGARRDPHRKTRDFLSRRCK